MSMPEGLLTHQAAALVDGVPEGAGKARIACGHEGVGCHPARRGAGVVARERVDDDSVHGLAVERAGHGVSQLNLAALTGLLIGQQVHDQRAQQVTADDVQVGRSRLGSGLLDQTADAPDSARLGIGNALGALERTDSLARQ